MKEKLHELLQAVISAKSKDASKALHEYLTSKTRSILSEMRMGEFDDELGGEDELANDYEGELGGEDELAGEEGDVESRLDNVEDRLDSVEDELVGDEGEGLGDEDDFGGEDDIEGELGDEGDFEGEVEGDYEEEQEKLVRRGRRRDKAAKGRLRR